MLDEPENINTSDSPAEPAPRRRRRAASRPAGPPVAEPTGVEEAAQAEPAKAPTTSTGTATVSDTADAEPPKRPRRTRKKAVAPTTKAAPTTEAAPAADSPSEAASTASVASSEQVPEKAPDAETKPARRRPRKKAEAAPEAEPKVEAADTETQPDTTSEPTGKPAQAVDSDKGADAQDKAPVRRRRGRPAVADPFAVPEFDVNAARSTSSAKTEDAAADKSSTPETDQPAAGLNDAGLSDAGQQGPDAEDSTESGGGRRRRGRGRGSRAVRSADQSSEDQPSEERPVANAKDDEDEKDEGASDKADSDQVSDRDDSDRDDSDKDDSDKDNSDKDDANRSEDDSDDDDESGGRRRRRRRGGRRRRRSGDDADAQGEGDDAEDGKSDSGRSEGKKSEDDSDDSDEDGESGGRRRRRRRSRSRRGGDEPDDGGRKRANDAVTGIDGSTRMEAKRQRRREGREAGRRRTPILSEAEFLARRESVKRTMIIRQGESMSQLAVLEDNNLVEHYVDNSSARSLIGNVYLGKVQNVLPSMEAAFIDIGEGRNAVLYAGELDWNAFAGNSKKIESVLKSGQTVLVQVTKDPVGAKGARLTNHISLPGRYIVYSPGGHLSGISRKLPDTERKRLKEVLSEHLDENASVIVRTAAEGASEDELVRDVNRLTLQWAAISKQTKGSAPQQLYAEPDLTVRIVRDLFTEDFAELIIQGNQQDDDAYDSVMDYVQHVAPHLVGRIRRWEDHSGGGNGGNGKDAFGAHRIDEQIARALDRKVHLPSGGSLIIDRTEAMTVIDVNTGKFTGTGGNLEATVTSNNLEAAEEIVRQLRLRDLGGIIVIDFIDMVLPSNRELLLRRLVECLGRDRTRHQVAEVTSLGLVQMTRKRIGTGLGEAFTTECEHCHGRGYVTHDEPLEIEPSEDNDRGGRGRNQRGGSNNRNGRSRGGNGQEKNTPPPRQPLPKVMPPIPDQFRKDQSADSAVEEQSAEADAAVMPESDGPTESNPAADSNAPVTADSNEASAEPTAPRARSARGKGARRATRGTTVGTAPAVQQRESVIEATPTAPARDGEPVAVDPLQGDAGETSVVAAADVPSTDDDRTVSVDLSQQGQIVTQAPEYRAPEPAPVSTEEDANADAPTAPIEVTPNEAKPEPVTSDEGP